MLVTVFFAPANVVGQRGQSIGGTDIATMAASIPGTGLENDISTLPDAPTAASQQTGPAQPNPSGATNPGPATKATEGGKQTKRILYIVPNFRAVSADVKLPPLTGDNQNSRTTTNKIPDPTTIRPSVLRFIGAEADWSRTSRFGGCLR